MTESRSPELRASDADRDRAAALFRDNLVAGRLTLDELSERLDGAHEARTLAQLDQLTADLPAETPGATESSRSRRTPNRWSVAVMGGVERTSRWRVPTRTTAVAVMGGVELDLRKAELDAPEVEIIAIAVMGGIEIVVPEGVDVELSGLAFMGGKEENVADVPTLPGAPLVRVRAFAFMGGIEVRSERASGRRRPALHA